MKLDWLSAYREVEVAGTRGRGRGRKKWKECVDDDMKKLGLKRECTGSCGGMPLLGNSLTYRHPRKRGKTDFKRK